MASSTDDDPAASGDHYVYVLECSDGTYYTGYTTDVERRVAEHNEGTAAKYTRGRRPGAKSRSLHRYRQPTSGRFLDYARNDGP
ncbi:MAG: endonuclease [Bacteroidetes bacterium SW_8_64_56]|nr:MAG: endonuclease [Bacteroidetes bacterium SW_8_64_56]